MDECLYVMFIERGKSYNKMTGEIAKRHIDHIRKLDEDGKVQLCGAFKGYPGVAGMVILKAKSYEEAEEICKTEPLVIMGYASYKLHTLRVANKDNNYLLK
jgi:uncharacterized protein YciI